MEPLILSGRRALQLRQVTVLNPWERQPSSRLYWVSARGNGAGSQGPHRARAGLRLSCRACAWKAGDKGCMVPWEAGTAHGVGKAELCPPGRPSALHPLCGPFRKGGRSLGAPCPRFSPLVTPHPRRRCCDYPGLTDEDVGTCLRRERSQNGGGGHQPPARGSVSRIKISASAQSWLRAALPHGSCGTLNEILKGPGLSVLSYEVGMQWSLLQGADN